MKPTINGLVFAYMVLTDLTPSRAEAHVIRVAIRVNFNAFFADSEP